MASPIQRLFDSPLIAEVMSKKYFNPSGGGSTSIVDDGNYVRIKYFPYKWFAYRLKRKYKTTRIEKMYELCGMKLFGRTTIRIHKFFLPEMVYILSQCGPGKPQDIAYDIIQNTWVRSIFDPDDVIKTDTDMSRLDAEMRCKFFDWQEEFIKLYDAKRRRNHLRGELLSFDCGLGKTLTALGVMTAIGCDGVVILAPKSTLQDVWVYHIQRYYKQAKRIFLVNKDTPKDAEFFIFNYESMDKLDTVMNYLKKKKRLGIIVDESHNFLRMKSLRTSNLLKLMDDTGCERCLMCSGTPLKALGSEVIPLLSVLDPMLDEEARDIFIKAFGINTTLGSDILHARMNIVMHRKTMDEVYRLPPKTDVDLPTKISTGSKYTIDKVKAALTKFAEERYKYHTDRMGKYQEEWDEAINWLDNNKTIGTSDDWRRYMKLIDYLIEKGYDHFNRWCVTENIWANEYERHVLIPALPKKLKDGFEDSRSKIKYLNLCIRGEVLGHLDVLRSEMVVDLMKEVDIEDIVSSSVKKVIFATTYVSVVDYLQKRCEELGYSPICIYGKTSNKAPELLEAFRDKDEHRVLIATMQTLATGVTVTEANTVVFCNNPWRDSDKVQMSHRVHRIGQDTECFIITVRLDTGSSPNLSDRTQDILNWSKEMTDAIVDGKRLTRASIESYGYDVEVEPTPEASTETFKARDEDVQKLIDNAKVLDRKGFEESIKEGDIIIPYKRAKYVTGLIGTIVTKLNRLFQGSSFTSCKLVGKEGKEIIGYGVVAGKGNINKAGVKKFLDMHEGAVVLRHPGMTDEIRKKVTKIIYAKKEEQVPYDPGTLFTSIWHHIFRRTTNKENKEWTNSEKAKLMCSNMINLIYKHAGLTIKYDSGIGDKYIWPKDILLSKSLKVVGAYFNRESGMHK